MLTSALYSMYVVHVVCTVHGIYAFDGRGIGIIGTMKKWWETLSENLLISGVLFCFYSMHPLRVSFALTEFQMIFSIRIQWPRIRVALTADCWLLTTINLGFALHGGKSSASALADSSPYFWRYSMRLLRTTCYYLYILAEWVSTNYILLGIRYTYMHTVCNCAGYLLGYAKITIWKNENERTKERMKMKKKNVMSVAFQVQICKR